MSSLIGVLAGFYAGYTYYGAMSAFLADWVSNKGYLNIVSFLIIFCGIFLIISILGIIIKYLLNIAFLGWVDRISGAGLGVIKGGLIVSVLLVVLTAFLPKGTPIVENSILAPHVSLVSENIVKVASTEIRDAFAEKIEEPKKAWKKQR
jgi:membrane protein required for colicin V production